METPSGDMPTHSNYTIDLSVGDTSTFSTEVREHDDASSDDPGRLPYLDRLTDRVVTGDLDIDIWVWMIEYLAKFKKELWMLHDVFEMSPNVPDYMGEHTKEMVAFRCLAYLFDPTTAQDSNVASGVESKIEFNLSESCEYVLQCILDETPLSDLKSGAPELSKWNLLPFIENKRISLPKCALELLRGASCETCTGIFPSNRQETMRIDGNNSGQVTLEQQRPILGKENDSSCCKSNRCNVTVPDSLEENDEVKRGTSLVDENLCAKTESKLDAADATVDNDNEHITQIEKCFDLSNNNQEGRVDNNEFMALMALVELQGTSDATDRNDHLEASDNVNILLLEMKKGITLSTMGLNSLEKHSSNEDAESEDQQKTKGKKQTDSLLEVASTDKNLSQRETIDGCPSSLSVNRYTSKQCEKGC